MLSKALELAKNHQSGGKQKLVAITTDKRGRIISIGKNSYIKTHPFQKLMATLVGMEECIYLHAEISALIQLKNQQPHNIYIARVSANGTPLLAKPCPICEKAIQDSGIVGVYYTE